MKKLLTCVALVVTAAALHSQASSEADTLRAMEAQWNEALKNHNAAWLQNNFADDMTDISSGNGALHNKFQDIATLSTDKTVYESLELSDLMVRIAGDAALVTGINHLKGRDENGEAFDLRLAFTDTYIRRDGRWQVWATQHTRVRP